MQVAAGGQLVEGAALQRLSEARAWLPRLSVVVVGPGLGEDPGPQAAAATLIR